MSTFTIYSINTFANECGKESKQFNAYINEDKTQYEDALNSLNQRINQENNDIKKMNSDISESYNIIRENQNEINVGEKNISYYQENISNCESEIRALEAEKSRLLAMTDENGKHPDVSHINARIALLKQDIANFKDSIYKVELAIERFRNNISSLNSIAHDLEGCIKDKQQIINDMANTINCLTEDYKKYQRIMISLQSSLVSLKEKISHSAHIITNYGDCISSIRYSYTSVGYSEFRNMYVTSSDLYDEAKAFENYYFEAEAKADLIRKELHRYSSTLEDKLSESSSKIVNKVDEKITNINKYIYEFSRTLKSCAEIICDYERNF